MPELQQPDIVGNFLSSYGTAQAQQQAQKDRAFQQQRVMRQDEMAQQQFDWQAQDRALEAAAEATSKELRMLKPGDEVGFNAALQRLVQQGHIKPEDAPKYNYRMLPQLLEDDKKWREAQAFKMEQQAAGQRGRLTEAQIAAANRANRPVVAGPGGLRGAPGMPSGKAPPEWAAKDAMWVKRGTEANNQFTPELTQALTTSTKDWVARGLGEFNSGLGNIAQTKQSRQASQIAKNFVAVVLRKDTGAAVTPKEFDFYQDIFIPQYGDDEGTLQLKSTARNTFLQALGSGLSNYQALQAMNITPPEGLAPSDGDASAGAQTAADDEVTWTFDAQGNLVQAK